ncbi:MAG: hypothetical protein ABI597_11695 [Gammaproteobacteria bacterium]
MSYSAKPLDTSSELLVTRFRQGIKLIKPDIIQPLQKNWHRMAQLLNMPFHIYFMNTDSVVQAINKSCVINVGFESEKDAIGRTVLDIAKKETANYSLRHDQLVIKSKNMIIKDDYLERLKDDVVLSGISIKCPWYGIDNEIIGVFGFS